MNSSFDPLIDRIDPKRSRTAGEEEVSSSGLPSSKVVDDGARRGHERSGNRVAEDVPLIRGAGAGATAYSSNSASNSLSSVQYNPNLSSLTRDRDRSDNRDARSGFGDRPVSTNNRNANTSSSSSSSSSSSYMRGGGGGGTVVDDNKACFEFKNTGKCKKGDSCHFAHLEVEKRFCFDFNNSGSCSKGDSCIFAHEKIVSTRKSNSSDRSLSSSSSSSSSSTSSYTRQQSDMMQQNTKLPKFRSTLSVILKSLIGEGVVVELKNDTKIEGFVLEVSKGMTLVLIPPDIKRKQQQPTSSNLMPLKLSNANDKNNDSIDNYDSSSSGSSYNNSNNNNNSNSNSMNYTKGTNIENEAYFESSYVENDSSHQMLLAVYEEYHRRKYSYEAEYGDGDGDGNDKAAINNDRGSDDEAAYYEDYNDCDEADGISKSHGAMVGGGGGYCENYNDTDTGSGGGREAAAQSRAATISLFPEFEPDLIHINGKDIRYVHINPKANIFNKLVQFEKNKNRNNTSIKDHSKKRNRSEYVENS